MASNIPTDNLRQLEAERIAAVNRDSPVQPKAGVRPKIDYVSLEATISEETRTSEAIGIMEDAFREAVKHRFGHYYSGPEEREARKRLEGMMNTYFTSKTSRPEALAYTQPSMIVSMIKVMSTSGRTNEPVLTDAAMKMAETRPQWQTDEVAGSKTGE